VTSQPSHSPDPESAGALATLGSRLDSLASTPAPPSGVDIDRAVVEGRAGRRRRTAGVLSSSVATLAVVGVVAAVAVGHTRAAAHTAGGLPAATASRPGDAATTSALLVGNGDPLVPGARFGWLPGSASASSETIQVEDGVLWQDSSGSGGSDPSSFRLGTFAGPQTAQGALQVLETGWSYHVSGHTTVGSQTAYWLARPVPDAGGGNTLTDLALVWPQPGGHWSALSGLGNGLSTASLQQQMLHVARTVTPDSTPVALPLHVGHVPEGAALDDLDLQPTGADWGLDFSLWTPSYTLVYDVGAAGTVLPQTLGPSRCKTAQGAQACVTMEAGAFSKSAAAGGVLDAALADVTLTGAGQSAWTTDVFSH
jgi:hypothetical protein